MEGMNQLFMTETNMKNYGEYVGVYAVSRVQGQSHGQAISSLKAFLRAVGYF
jgi:hypothetical protein